MSDPTDEALMTRWQTGDEGAAAEIVRRHAADLLAVVRRRMSGQLAGRADAEDVVQSALRSFFVAAHDGKFAADRGGDLWRLLSTIALNKLRKLVRRHTTGKRSVRSEQGFADPANQTVALEAGGRDRLTPLEALALVEQLEAVLAAVPAERRAIVELRLEGHDLAAIAAAVGCSERTVRRVLTQAREALEAAAAGD